MRLRDERVEVERRRVDQRVSPADRGGDAFRERTVEVTGKAEEAAVSKDAEEIVVRKGPGERTKTVRGTLRRTEVEVEGERAPAAKPSQKT